MNRIDRVTAILIQLQSRKVVKAQDIAERFEISLRTVYRDVATLQEAGVPIVGEAGIGYSIMDGYRLPPVMFTQEEAMAFLTAEKLVEKLTDATIKESYLSAMYKVKAVLRSSEKEYLENINEHIEVIGNPYLPKNSNTANPLQSILKSISEKQVLMIDYFTNHSQERNKRNIEPVGIVYISGHWHLVAFCQLRNDYRNFRTDRISQIEFAGQSFKKEHPSLKNYLKQISKEKELQTVVIRVEKKTAKFLGDQKFYNGYVSQKEANNKIEMTFLSASLEGFARWFMMFGDKAEIMEPETLKNRISEISTAILKANSNSNKLKTSELTSI